MNHEAIKITISLALIHTRRFAFRVQRTGISSCTSDRDRRRGHCAAGGGERTSGANIVIRSGIPNAWAYPEP
jgi:hypothetical protein